MVVALLLLLLWLTQCLQDRGFATCSRHCEHASQGESHRNWCVVTALNAPSPSSDLCRCHGTAELQAKLARLKIQPHNVEGGDAHASGAAASEASQDATDPIVECLKQVRTCGRLLSP